MITFNLFVVSLLIAVIWAFADYYIKKGLNSRYFRNGDRVSIRRDHWYESVYGALAIFLYLIISDIVIGICGMKK